MAALSSFKEELACPICLELLSDPVTANCGHNFCSKCIEGVWSEAGKLHQDIQCPQCRHCYTEQPVLKKNTLLITLIDQLTQEPVAFSGDCDDVPCDWCLETVIKAEKTCLTCMASYCLAHLRPHTQNAAYLDHEVTSPVRNLQERKCKDHRKIQDVFCKKHFIFICDSCNSGHKCCTTTSLEELYKEKQMDLQRILGEITEEIKAAEGKLDALANERCSVNETASKMKILIGEKFKEVKKLLITKEESMKKLIDDEYAEIETKIEAASRELFEHIEGLNKTKNQIEPLAKEKDQWRFMKATSSIPNQVTHLPSPGEPVEMYKRRLQFIHKHALELISSLKPKLEKFWQEIFKYGEACELTFDPKTAHTRVALSEGNRRMFVNCSQSCEHNPERFSHYWQVLCSQNFSKGCHYWDISTKHSSGWAIGIAYKSIRKESSLGHTEESWCVQWERNCYHLSAWHSGIQLKLACVMPQTVRVCLDFNGGSVSFYSVSDSVSLLHKYDVAFRGPVYPACLLTSSEANSALVLETPL
ncbi:E3 ubiquitin/ISG15 ligase TRIM25-like [Heterodontus francisci]|uniref:E3 ubiquitin/ISG15 ligase TRIM25-like n=1 Tax=Heterodontus francisci TaxID=7792 RepID=UPI00355BABD1